MGAFSARSYLVLNLAIGAVAIGNRELVEYKRVEKTHVARHLLHAPHLVLSYYYLYVILILSYYRIIINIIIHVARHLLHTPHLHCHWLSLAIAYVNIIIVFVIIIIYDAYDAVSDSVHNAVPTC